ncbi:sugar ABC transporter substrate-binding protein [Vagococcus fluvialis]|uniref:sugar ABC transporter substrate-binding protein n=1 Tax=Vagococcus fluvialis TaxID=2738 RepID=UPI00288CC82B|nr:sugar ABC transporter substrate-binding protein [Vagococcus fluvialis]MDT2746693.1 sugar ABC transporter substrate-binding protein [Vagococcus fluvialis]
MKLVKKLGLLAAGLALTTALVACGNNDKKEESAKSKDDEFTLTVWTHPFVGTELKAEQTEVFDKMAEEFKKDYPNAKIAFEEIPWANREQKIMTALSSGDGPDMFYLIPDMMTQFADKGILEPMDDHLGKDFDAADFSETSLEAVTYDGKKYGLPILREVQTMFYNTDILKEVGGDPEKLPETWEEFDALAKKAVEKGYAGRTFEGGSTLNSTLYPFIWQAGGDIIKDGEAVIDSKESVEAFTEIKKLYDEGIIPKDSINATEQTGFQEGKMLAAYGTGYLISSMAEQGKENYVIGAPLKQKEQATFGTTGMFSVASTSKHKAESAKFVEVMTNSENAKSFNKLTNYIPARTSALTIFDDNERMKDLAQYVEIANPGVIHPSARIFMPNVQAKLQAMLEGSLTPEEAAKEANELIKNEMK